ncbi:iron chaperone [Cuneatibacter caecimuris]|uniref:YdhG-like domain-containing protein n=1 Tax=Cuneatibacter caecimuris TaxID=1796618 RepID=A0A4Q7PRW2_9FIRM|nr:iron chaperone [Cuneatibacter caecimuris]RZT02010.1 hypothetical protein EV209_0112 [Cuneatibacter caecimuris]
MNDFSAYIKQLTDERQRVRTEEVLDWVSSHFSNLEPRIAWNQPMFTDHGTFIIGFSASRNHLSVSPEQAGMAQFQEKIAKAGYGQSKMLFRIRWDEPVNYTLLEQIIRFNCMDKAECTTFWRK